MTKLTYTKTIATIEEITVPDYFAYDETRRGKWVDAYLSQRYYASARDDLYSSDEHTVKRAISYLEDAYDFYETTVNLLVKEEHRDSLLEYYI